MKRKQQEKCVQVVFENLETSHRLLLFVCLFWLLLLCVLFFFFVCVCVVVVFLFLFVCFLSDRLFHMAGAYDLKHSSTLPLGLGVCGILKYKGGLCD